MWQLLLIQVGVPETVELSSGVFFSLQLVGWAHEDSQKETRIKKNAYHRRKHNIFFVLVILQEVDAGSFNL